MTFKRSRLRGIWLRLAWLLLFALNLLLSQGTSQTVNDQLRTNAQSKIQTFSLRFAEIQAHGARENQLRADCRSNCGAIADAATGKTVSDELNEIVIAKDAALDRVIVEIQIALDDYIVRTVRPTDSNLNSRAVAKVLGLILQDEAVQPPAAFVLRSPKGSSLLVFYGLKRGTSPTSTTILRAYVANAGSLRLSDSSGTDMNNYLDLEVKELHSPKPDEIWLLVAGKLIGANGPNIRMRVFAYDGRKFRAVWMPANQWGEFTTHVTEDGFTVDGDYYQSSQHRHEAYRLAADGLYLKRPGE